MRSYSTVVIIDPIIQRNLKVNYITLLVHCMGIRDWYICQ